ncbi:MAG: MerR family DNA-binding transcriptional regulator [Bacillus sp. (in: firmicutes)]
MGETKKFYKDKKIITLDIVTGITGLSEEEVQFYAERCKIVPNRTKQGTPAYSLSEIETIMSTYHLIGHSSTLDDSTLAPNKKLKAERQKMRQGQFNSQFRIM